MDKFSLYPEERKRLEEEFSTRKVTMLLDDLCYDIRRYSGALNPRAGTRAALLQNNILYPIYHLF